MLSNMRPDAGHPARGSFVRDQVEALRAIGGVEIELVELAPGPRALVAGGAALRRRYRHDRFDVVHAHFGLTAWPSLAVPARVRALTMHGTDLADPRTRALTRAVLPRIDLPAAVSADLAARVPGSAAARTAVLPCGVDTERFRPIPRARARVELGLPAAEPLLLFPANPARREKRYERARELAELTATRLLVLADVPPERVPLFVNAASAVVITSEREGFGLAALEALACDVPVLATPVGVHPEALGSVAGTLCASFEPRSWTQALEPLLADPDPRVEGRGVAERWSATAMAKRVEGAWLRALGGSR